MVIEQDITLSDWDAMGPMGTHYRLWTISAPFVKSTHDKRSGIAYMTGIVAA